MSKMTYGTTPDEAVQPRDRPEQHIASGSGWEDPGARGGGSVPHRNPWLDDPPHENPAQDGTGLVRYRGPGIHGPERG